jgi:hypothetical protein
MANRKEPTMKLFNIMWVLALAAAAVACDAWTDQPPITNERPPPPTGGSGGDGGTGGTGNIGEGACTTDENLAVYEGLTFTDEEGVTSSGAAAAAAIGSACIFGSADSVPPLTGCGDLSLAVLGCFPNCDQNTIDALANCVADCTQEATAEISSPGLSEDCMACTGDTVACGAAFCTNVCVADTNAAVCINCRCANGCIEEFDKCSGLPPSTTCP